MRWFGFAIVLLVCCFLGIAGVTAYSLRPQKTVKCTLMVGVQGDRSARHVDFMEWAKTHHATVLFLGGSLTDHWRDVPELFNERFPGAANFGVGDDRIENIVWRVERGEVEAVSPEVVVLECGANNLLDCPTDEVMAGIANLVFMIGSHAPHAHIVLIGVFPFKPGESGTAKAREVNQSIAQRPGVEFIDPMPLLMPGGQVEPSIQSDGLHLTPKGYRILADALREHLPKTPG